MSILYTTNQCLPVNSLQTNIRSNFYNVPGNPNWETALMIREHQSTLESNPLMDGASIDDHQITVCVRKRSKGGQSERTRCDLCATQGHAHHGRTDE